MQSSGDFADGVQRLRRSAYQGVNSFLHQVVGDGRSHILVGSQCVSIGLSGNAVVLDIAQANLGFGYGVRVVGTSDESSESSFQGFDISSVTAGSSSDDFGVGFAVEQCCVRSGTGQDSRSDFSESETFQFQGVWSIAVGYSRGQAGHSRPKGQFQRSIVHRHCRIPLNLSFGGYDDLPSVIRPKYIQDLTSYDTNLY
ncbi:hypothetical protein D9M69_340050 [compost metagenome]